MPPVALVLIIVAVVLTVALIKTIVIVPQARVGIVERFGKYQRTLQPGVRAIVPLVERVRCLVDLREQEVTLLEPVICADNYVVAVDTVVYMSVSDPVLATYEIFAYRDAVKQLTLAALRNIVGDLERDQALTSGDWIARHLTQILAEAAGRWGLTLKWVEVRSIAPHDQAATQDPFFKLN